MPFRGRRRRGPTRQVDCIAAARNMALPSAISTAEQTWQLCDGALSPLVCRPLPGAALRGSNATGGETEGRGRWPCCASGSAACRGQRLGWPAALPRRSGGLQVRNRDRRRAQPPLLSRRSQRTAPSSPAPMWTCIQPTQTSSVVLPSSHCRVSSTCSGGPPAPSRYRRDAYRTQPTQAHTGARGTRTAHLDTCTRAPGPSRRSLTGRARHAAGVSPGGARARAGKGAAGQAYPAPAPARGPTSPSPSDGCVCAGGRSLRCAIIDRYVFQPALTTAVTMVRMCSGTHV